MSDVQQNVIAQINITLSNTGAINVNGSIENKMMAYGLLEAAKEAVMKFHEQQQKLVQPAPFAIVPRNNG